MSKKSGLFAFVAGLAAGAATLFLSDEENREKAKEAVASTKRKAEVEVKKATKATKKSVAQAKREVKRTVKRVKKSAKPVATKAPKKLVAKKVVK